MIDKLLKKHAKNFVTGERHDGKLEGIHYHENGSIYVTDTHKLLAFHDSHNSLPYTKHYKTGKAMIIDYPDVTRIISTEFKHSIALSVKKLKGYLPVIKLAAELNTVGNLIAKDGHLMYSVYHDNESFKLLLGETDESFRLCLNGLYFYHMLDFFKDAQVDEIIFSIQSGVLPLSFRSGNYEVIILPIRRY